MVIKAIDRSKGFWSTGHAAVTWRYWPAWGRTEDNPVYAAAENILYERKWNRPGRCRKRCLGRNFTGTKGH